MPVVQPHRQVVESSRESFAAAHDGHRTVRRVDVFPRVLVQRVRRLRAGLSFFTSGLLRDGRGLFADVAPFEGPPFQSIGSRPRSRSEA